MRDCLLAGLKCTPNNLLHRSALTGLVLGCRGINARPVNMALGPFVIVQK